MRSFQVKALLMGGQACVLYGAAEFSRDTDFAILAEDSNLLALSNALEKLEAHCIAVPPFERRYLDAGHAVHFRSQHPESKGMRIDLMSRLRGVDDFETLWERRTTFDLLGDLIEVISLPDLIQAKKTQRDKDWPMIRRLVESHYIQNQMNPSEYQIRFWLLEARTPEILMNVGFNHPAITAELSNLRPLLINITSSSFENIQSLLNQEEQEIRSLDRNYWLPLKKELESLRHQK
jgi:hypothetical protein